MIRAHKSGVDKIVIKGFYNLVDLFLFCFIGRTYDKMEKCL